MKLQPIDLAFASADIAEAKHALHMFGEVVRLLEDGRGNRDEAIRYGDQAADRLAVALRIIKGEGGAS